MKRIRSAVFAAALLLAAVSGGWNVARAQDDDLFELKKNFEIFGALYEQLIVGYVDHVRPGPFMHAGIDAMMSELDPYTNFYDQAVNLEMDLMRQGPLADVGLRVGMQSGRLTVLAPNAESGAYEAGIRVGDIVLRINGVDMSGLTVEDVTRLLRGDPGSTVTVELERQGEAETLVFELVRRVVRPSNVTYSGFFADDPSSGVAYVRLATFGRRSAREVRRALRDLKETASVEAVILDLRDNPGGILSEAIELVGLFVPRGTTVVSTKGRLEEMSQTYVTQSDPFYPDTPVVVLVNGRSASASEIVAGALQDLDRGVIVGEPTFGKGLVQVMRALPYNTSMKMTVAHYYTPSGRDIQSRIISSGAVELSTPHVESFRTAAGREVRSGRGIEPDVSVSRRSDSELVQALLEDGAFFRFAGELGPADRLAENPNEPLDTDHAIESFRNWLENTGFEYRSSVDALMDSLETRLGRLSYGESLESLREMRLRVQDEKRKEFDRFSREIETEIRRAVFGRYLSEPDRVRRLLETDDAAHEAAAIAVSRSRYRTLLGS